MPKLSLKVNSSRQSWSSPHPWVSRSEDNRAKVAKRKDSVSLDSSPSTKVDPSGVLLASTLSFDAGRVNKSERLLPRHRIRESADSYVCMSAKASK